MRHGSTFRRSVLGLLVAFTLGGAATSQASYTSFVHSDPFTLQYNSSSPQRVFTAQFTWGVGDTPITASGQWTLEVWDSTLTTRLSVFAPDTYYIY